MKHARPSFVTKEKIEILYMAYLLVYLSGIDVCFYYFEFSNGICMCFDELFYSNSLDIDKYSEISDWLREINGTKSVYIAPQGELLPRIKLLERILNNWEKYS